MTVTSEVQVSGRVIPPGIVCLVVHRGERKTPLKNRKSATGCPVNMKWNIIVNEYIEIDE